MATRTPAAVMAMPMISPFLSPSPEFEGRSESEVRERVLEPLDLSAPVGEGPGDEVAAAVEVAKVVDTELEEGWSDVLVLVQDEEVEVSAGPYPATRCVDWVPYVCGATARVSHLPCKAK